MFDQIEYLLVSITDLSNKRFTISIFSFSTAKRNEVLLNNIFFISLQIFISILWEILFLKYYEYKFKNLEFWNFISNSIYKLY